MKNKSKILITSPARLHLGFMDLNGSLGRKFGSVGLAIDSIENVDPLPAVGDLPVVIKNVAVPEPVDNDQSSLVRVLTDVFDLVIDLRGGDIVSVKLLDHLTEMPDDGGVPLQILERSNDRRYIASSGLIGADGTDSKDLGRPIYSARARDYALGDQDAIDVDLVVYQVLVLIVVIGLV